MNIQDTKVKSEKSLRRLIIIANVLAILFFYSPISLIGYWTDASFLLSISLTTLLFLKYIESNTLRGVLKGACYISLIALTINSFGFNGLMSVHLIPKGHYEDKETYAYFLERGNLGLLNGCYGDIEYHKRITWLPILEIKYETNYCSSMDYISIVNNY